MRTFGELRKVVLARTGCQSHFDFIERSRWHRAYWEEMNGVEYDLGYSPAYLEPDSPALCDMELLSETEFDQWLARLDQLGEKA